MQIEAHTEELIRLTALFENRATGMVPDAVTEATWRANDVASRGAMKGVRYPSGRFRRQRVLRRATGQEIARWVEHIMYRRLVDFFGHW